MQEAAAEPVVGSGLSFASFLRGSEAADSSSTASEATAPAEVTDQPSREQQDVEAGAAMQAKEAVESAPVREESPLIEPDASDASQPEIFIAPAAVAPAMTSHQEQAPSFMRTPASTRAAPRTAKWQWAAVFALAAILLVQTLVADRARLAADAGWRPIISALCGALGCSVPVWHQPGAITMLSRDVSPLAGSAGGLDVRATFRNDARWSQAWPVLLLSLSDADGRVLGARAFMPHEYLGADATQTELAPGQSARIALKLHEPDPDVVAFSFDFR